MKLLFLSTKSPVPPNDGGSLRNFHILRHLAQRYQVTLITFGSPQTCKEAVELQDMGVQIMWVNANNPGLIGKAIMVITSLLTLRPFTIQKYISPQFRNTVKQNLDHQGYDLVHLSSVHLFPYIRDLVGIPVIMDQHNVESQIWNRLNQFENRWWMKAALWLQEWLMDRYEQRARAAVDLVLAVSLDDEALMKQAQLTPSATVIIPNGVDVDFFTSRSADERTRAIVFVGAMDWSPNSDAVVHFAKHILPRIQQELPDVHFYIVGKNPPPPVKALGGPRITVTGTVEDVRPYYELAAVVVVPLRVGGGTRLKILEALSMGKAVVSTEVGAEGLGLTPEVHFILANEDEAFASATVRCLNSVELRQRVGSAGQQVVRRTYSWKFVCEPLHTHYFVLRQDR